MKYLLIILGILTLIILGFVIGRKYFISKYIESLDYKVVEQGTITDIDVNSAIAVAEKATQLAQKYSKNPKLYWVIINNKEGSVNFEEPSNSFAFHGDNENFALLFSIVPQTGNYKISKTGFSITSNNELIPVEKWKIDISQALEAAKPNFKVYDEEYPNSGGNYVTALRNRGGNFYWRFVYSVSSEYYNSVKQISPMSLNVDAQSGIVTKIKYPWEEEE